MSKPATETRFVVAKRTSKTSAKVAKKAAAEDCERRAPPARCQVLTSDTQVTGERQS